MDVAWAAFLFVLASAAVLMYAAYRYKQILSVTAYFIKAATVYILVGEEDARLAAVAADKGAALKDRNRMKEFVAMLSNSFRGQKGNRWVKQIERAGYLTKELDKVGAPCLRKRSRPARRCACATRSTCARSGPATPVCSCAATRNCSAAKPKRRWRPARIPTPWPKTWWPTTRTSRPSADRPPANAADLTGDYESRPNGRLSAFPGPHSNLLWLG